eukprot:671178-Prorocentrum_minimum.AAC.1
MDASDTIAQRLRKIFVSTHREKSSTESVTPQKRIPSVALKHWVVQFVGPAAAASPPKGALRIWIGGRLRIFPMQSF